MNADNLGMGSYCTGILPGHRCDSVFCLQDPSGNPKLQSITHSVECLEFFSGWDLDPFSRNRNSLKGPPPTTYVEVIGVGEAQRPSITSHHITSLPTENEQDEQEQV
ncbi:LAS seventeen-binding protein 3 [Fusarium oxysporum f. sp. albedinis]|nr:LAS seventeen-binding protein 3 [Fusarium oxysporum f. sp. albedinis]